MECFKARRGREGFSRSFPLSQAGGTTIQLKNVYTISLRTMARALLLMALPLAAVATFLHAQQGYLDAAFAFMDPMSSAKYGLLMGATVVRSVVPGSPAEQSGLRAGDLITSVDGVQMRSPAEVADAFRAHRPGSKAKVGII